MEKVWEALEAPVHDGQEASWLTRANQVDEADLQSIQILRRVP